LHLHARIPAGVVGASGPQTGGIAWHSRTLRFAARRGENGPISSTTRRACTCLPHRREAVATQISRRRQGEDPDPLACIRNGRSSKHATTPVTLAN